jgi:hypothetical protein
VRLGRGFARYIIRGIEVVEALPTGAKETFNLKRSGNEVYYTISSYITSKYHAV